MKKFLRRILALGLLSLPLAASAQTVEKRWDYKQNDYDMEVRCMNLRGIGGWICNVTVPQEAYKDLACYTGERLDPRECETSPAKDVKVISYSRHPFEVEGLRVKGIQLTFYKNLLVEAQAALDTDMALANFAVPYGEGKGAKVIYSDGPVIYDHQRQWIGKEASAKFVKIERKAPEDYSPADMFHSVKKVDGKNVEVVWYYLVKDLSSNGKAYRTMMGQQ